MNRERLVRTSHAALISFLLVGCNSAEGKSLNHQETALTTDGELAKYHYLIKEPYSAGLSHEGFLIGIEKSLNNRIGYKFPDLDETRFRKWEPRDDSDGHIIFLPETPILRVQRMIQIRHSSRTS